MLKTRFYEYPIVPLLAHVKYTYPALSSHVVSLFYPPKADDCGGWDALSTLLEFYDPVNIIEVMSSRLVNLLTFFLGRLVLSAVNQFLCTSFPQKLTIALLESVEGENDC